MSRPADDRDCTRRAFLALGGALAAGWAMGRAGADEPPAGAEKHRLTREQHFELWKRTTGAPYEGRMPGVCKLPGPDRKVKFPDPEKYRGVQKVHGMCQMCSTVCGITGLVKDGRIVKIEGNPLDPSSRGKLCAKGQAGLNHQYHPERLLYPLARVGARGEGRWKRITWEEAYALLAARLKAVRESGRPEEFAFHQGRNRTPDMTDAFLNAFGTPTVLNHRGLCSAARRAANRTALWETDWELGDFERTTYILNFGNNLFEAFQGHVPAAQRVQRARFENGAKLVTFDVRMSNTAGNSDEFHQPFPGTDGAIALAMAHTMVKEDLADRAFFETWTNGTLAELFEQIRGYTPEWAERLSGIPAATIVRIAREFAAAKPRCTTLSARGTSAHINGYFNDRAIRLLDALAGNLGRPGGQCWMYTGATDARRFPAPERAPAPPGGALDDPPEFVLANAWAKMKVGEIVYLYLAQGRARIQVYMSYNLDSPLTWPEMDVTRNVLLDETRVPFHVAINPFYSETAHFADLVLPWATYLERWDVDARGAYNLKAYLSMRRPMVPALGEAKDIREIFPELARRIGGGMEQWPYALWPTERYLAEWVKNVPFDRTRHASPLEYLGAVGAFEDPAEQPYYEPYRKPLTEAQLAGSRVDRRTGVITGQDGQGIGILIGGQPVVGFKTPSRKFEVRSDYLVKMASGESADPEIRRSGVRARSRPPAHRKYAYPVSPWPVYLQIVEHLELAPDQLVMTSFKWNVHTHGRTANLKWLSEIVHSNPAWLHPDTARRLGIANGDWVELTAWRSRTVDRLVPSLKLGSGEIERRLVLPVVLKRGLHPRVIAVSNSLGHGQYSRVAQALRDAPLGGQAAGMDPAGMRDADWERNLWWEDRSGGDRRDWKRNTGKGWAQNAVVPIAPDPISGQQAFNDTVVRVRKA